MDNKFFRINKGDRKTLVFALVFIIAMYRHFFLYLLNSVLVPLNFVYSLPSLIQIAAYAYGMFLGLKWLRQKADKLRKKEHSVRRILVSFVLLVAAFYGLVMANHISYYKFVSAVMAMVAFYLFQKEKKFF